MADYPENPGWLPAHDLINKSDAGKGPLGRAGFCLKDPELVKHLQEMLVKLEYDLGTSGPEKDGVDGSFGKLTETAVKDFQEKNLDWDANQLEVDGRVGPRTSDALNRAMVGKWYDRYQTPGELVENKQLHTVTSEFLTKGLSIKPDTSHKARILLADKKKLKTIEVAQDLKLLLGVEVARRGEVKTRGRFDIGTLGVEYDPLDRFSSSGSFIGEQDGDIHFTFLELGDLNRKAILIEAGKSNVLETYNEKTGETTFLKDIYPTEEMVATIHIFKGEKCLTGNMTFEDVKIQMYPTKTGINQILVRLDENSDSIQDCIIDEVVYIAEGQQKVRMAR